MFKLIFTGKAKYVEHYAPCHLACRAGSPGCVAVTAQQQSPSQGALVAAQRAGETRGTREAQEGGD